MTRARKHGSERGALGDISRLALAAGLLGAVGVVTVMGVNSTSSKVQRGRLKDRIDLTNALAAPLSGWLKAVPSSPAPGWDALRVDASGRFTGVSGRYQALSGNAQSHPCATGSGLRDLVDAATHSAARAVLVIDPPGSCDPLLGVATPTAGGTVVVTTDIDALVAQVPAASSLGPDISTYVVDPGGTALTPGPAAVPAPPHLVPFAARVAGGQPATARLTAPEPRSHEVVDAGAPIGNGWSIVLQQDAAGFDVGQVVKPSATAMGLIAGLFAAVLLLQAWSDARRRAAARHADAHAAAFLAVLGHELRTPLTVIKGFVDTLAQRWDAMGDDQRHDLVDRLPQQSRRLNRVVDRLLLAANMQAGVSAPVSVAPIGVASALEQIAATYSALAPLHEFVVDAPGDVIARGDAKAVPQILDQLVDNAVKYSPEGGVVRLSARRVRGRVEIAIEDEGVGLPRDLNAIFDAFAQGEDVDGRVHDEGGVGVGLYIVRTLCEQLGGSVRAERRARGARFVVTLHASRERALSRV
ncbi:MAG: HAMP domain-containing histidine kinase [Acidimicrobiia bacterium]|nr:HAMP domain-containing histidine kinase [Acidimicrobiia bacterium]